jgi:hypothetical protein
MLSDQFKFFHGTTHPFRVGDEILPVSMRDAEALHDETDVEAAYASRDVESARFWADEAASKMKAQPRVFGVEPLGRVLEDMHSFNDDDVRSREGWRVLGEIEE